MLPEENVLIYVRDLSVMGKTQIYFEEVCKNAQSCQFQRQDCAKVYLHPQIQGFIAIEAVLELYTT